MPKEVGKQKTEEEKAKKYREERKMLKEFGLIKEKKKGTRKWRLLKRCSKKKEGDEEVTRMRDH